MSSVSSIVSKRKSTQSSEHAQKAFKMARQLRRSVTAATVKDQSTFMETTFGARASSFNIRSLERETYRRAIQVFEEDIDVNIFSFYAIF